MASLADTRPGGIKEIAAEDVATGPNYSDGRSFRGVINLSGAAVDLTYISHPSDGPKTRTIPAGASYGFTFKPTAVPAGTLDAYYDYEKPQS